jgi:hypothetical protein
VLALLLAATGDGGTGVPYVGTVATPITVGALFYLLWRIQRASDRDKGARIDQLHDDITEADRRARDAAERLSKCEESSEKLAGQAAACEWRLDIVLDVLEAHGIAVPAMIRARRPEPPEMT